MYYIILHHPGGPVVIILHCVKTNECYNAM